MLALSCINPHFTFRFTHTSPLLSPLDFPTSLTAFAPARTTRKRCRPLADIDDYPPSTPLVHGRKKRRLRLSLITSRLSRPFSKPATYIVDRGNCKVAVWARQRCLARVWLRKRAILNSVRGSICLNSKRVHALVQGGAGAADYQEPPTTLVSPNSLHARRESFEEDRAPHLARRPLLRDCRRASAFDAQAPSPLGLSNYDALDDDDSYSTYSEQASEEADEDWAYTPHPDLANEMDSVYPAAIATTSQPQQDYHTSWLPPAQDYSLPLSEYIASPGPPSPCSSSASNSSFADTTIAAQRPLAHPSVSPATKPNATVVASPSDVRQHTSPLLLPPSPAPSPPAHLGLEEHKQPAQQEALHTWSRVKDPELQLESLEMRPPSPPGLELEPPEEEMFDLVKRRFGGQRFLGLWVSG